LERNKALTGKEIRLNRLFSNGENAVVIAVDHGEFDGPLPGMINLPEVVGKIDPCVSAILLSPGMLPHCGHAFSYKGAPMAMVRLNWSTVYAFHWGYNDAETVEAASLSTRRRTSASRSLASSSRLTRTSSPRKRCTSWYTAPAA